jgi:hypothetical protein
LEIDGEFEAQRTSATLRGDLQRVMQTAAKQMINDQAYFVLCWGQLELAIDDACRNAIRRRQASGNWAVRRAWDLYNPDDRRLSGLRFEDRTALVLDRSGGQRSPWARVMYYYSLRNQIAHGELLADGIEVGDVVLEFFQIQGALQA